MMAQSLEVRLRGNVTRYFSGHGAIHAVAHVQQHRRQPAPGALEPEQFPANNYDLSGEWARADFDQRHRFNLLGTINPGRYFKLGVAASLYSGAPVFHDDRTR